MSSIPWWLAVTLAVPATLKQMTELSAGRFLGKDSGARGSLRELEYLTNLSEKLGDTHCPKELRARRDRVARRLAAHYAVDYDDGDSRWIRQFSITYFALALLMAASMSAHLPHWSTQVLQVVLVVSSVFFVYRLALRLKCRRALYERLGSWSSAIEMPPMSWGLRSQYPSLKLLDSWIDDLVPHADAPALITDGEVEKLGRKFLGWCQLSTWRRW